MICLSCLRSASSRVCDYCGGCPHLCKESCQMKRRLNRIKISDRERNRIYYIKDDPIKKIVNKNGNKVHPYVGSMVRKNPTGLPHSEPQ